MLNARTPAPPPPPRQPPEHRMRGLASISRAVILQFAPDDSGVTLTMGDTRVMTVVTAVLEPPFPDRPNEGSLRINVEFSPMASPNFEAGRPGALPALIPNAEC